DLIDFLESVEMIFELGAVTNEQERKRLLTSYLPVSKRLFWRTMKTYDEAHSYAEFRAEIEHLHPELAERELGTLTALNDLCAAFRGVALKEEGKLRRFGLQFTALVAKLQRAPALLTNRDACRHYLRTLTSDFARRV
ncbi:hypothetical protein C8F01DRAFT_930841, partial [Mycena amicta]